MCGRSVGRGGGSGSDASCIYVCVCSDRTAIGGDGDATGAC